MSAIWFTSDTHFRHRHMAATHPSGGWRPFATIDEHDQYLIDQWNAVVSPLDQVWHLGDVGLGDEDEVLNIIRRLNGRKHLIAGNHDPVWPGHRQAHRHQRKWLEVFESVQAFARRRVGNHDVMLSHLPYQGDHVEQERYTQFRLRDQGDWLICGHVHDLWDIKDRQINVGVDVREWKPILLDEIVKIIRDDYRELSA